MSSPADAGRVRAFLVPDLGEGLEDVTVTGWHVAVGDRVALNEPLCTVETAKAEVEIPSPYPGRVVELGGAVGEVLTVGALLARVEIDPDARPADQVEPAEQVELAGPAEPVAPTEPAATRRPVLVGYGADDTFDTSRRADAAPARPRAKPAARKLAADLGIDLDAVRPGPSGVITVADVHAAADPSPAASEGELLVPDPVQTAMAERITLSRSMIPDAHASVQVDGARLLELRDRLLPAGEAITPFVLMLRMLIVALTHHRVLNSTWVDSPAGPRVRTHRDVHLGFGVAAPRGLLVPVIGDAHTKTTRELADCVARLIHGARAGTLKPAELRGSTFTVSNFGALGLDDGVPVINYPEAAIVGIGSLKPRPVAIDGAVVVRPQLTLTCVFDHRIADGAQVAGFLCELRDLIESPDTALLDL